MLKTSKKLLGICLTGLILVTCVSCKAVNAYKVSEYLNDLSVASGIGNYSKTSDNIDALISWGVIDEDEYKTLDNDLDYAYLIKTLCRLLECDEAYLVKYKVLNKYKYADLVEVNEGKNIIDKAVKLLNDKQFDSKFDYKFSDKVKEYDDNLVAGDVYYDELSNSYKKIIDEETTIDAELEDIYEDIDMQESFEINFDDAVITPYGNLEDTSYVNNKYNLLAKNNNHVFNSNGYRVSYRISASSFFIHVAKKIDKMNVFADLSIRNVKTSFKYTSEDKSLKNCFFNVKMNTTEQLGVTTGKYNKYYLTLKNLKGNDFASKVKSMFKSRADEIEAIIPICKISTPIPNIPIANLDFEVVVKLFANGKVELVLYNTHDLGFEIKDGNFRCFYNHEDDFDALARASGKANIGINVSVDAGKIKLCDVELDGGLKAEMKSTVHLYDSDGYLSSEGSEYPYSMLEELTKENPDVWICGDLSFYWNADLMFNTFRTKLNKWGFFKTIHILDDDNQVFGNLHHIENGQFVKKCTRKSRTKINSTNLNVNSADKIILNDYSAVVNIGSTYLIEIKDLPSGYSIADIKYASSDEEVVSVSDGSVYACNLGSAQIEVYTSDKKYSAYVNILVSTG